MAQALQDALGAYLRPRDEVTHIRRVLAVHLNECLQVQTSQDASPLALQTLSAGGGPERNPVARGLQREYLQAVRAHAQALEEYAAAGAPPSSMPAPAARPGRDGAGLLEAQLALARLREKQRRLEVAERYVGKLGQQTAAEPDFLSPARIFAGASPLPEVPAEVMQGFADGNNGGELEVQQTISRLERSVFGAKMLRMREATLLAEAQKVHATAGGRSASSARARALMAVRDELIGWIESKLPQTSAAEEDEDEDAEQEPCAEEYTPEPQEEQLARVAQKYEEYLSSRRALLHLLSQQAPAASSTRPSRSGDVTETAKSTNASSASATLHLLPYIENLLGEAHKQKLLIQHKGNLNVALARQLKETCQNLDHQAEESQLLPAHRPRPGVALRRNPTLGDDLSSMESLDCTSRVKPWAFAADSAKIATLEAVMERVEEGQTSIEQGMENLDEIDRLLGRGGKAIGSDAESPGPLGHPAAQNMSSAAGQPEVSDIWAVLKGDLGLLKS
jgi:hypothetical protein